MIATVFGHATGPFAFDILCCHPCSRFGNSSSPVCGLWIKRARERHGLDNCGVIPTWYKRHKAAHTPRVVNQCAQIGSGTLATSAFQNNTSKAKLCQMVV